MTKTVRAVTAEEGGLVTIVAAAAMRGGPKPDRTCLRVRLSPPRKLLREDGHVFDLEAALAFARTNVIAPLRKLATWTDTVAGVGRLTVSFATKDAEAVEQVLEALDLAPYNIEQLVENPSAKARLKQLFFALDHAEHTMPKGDPFTTLPKSPGSFAKLSGLDTPKLGVRKVMKALAWLDKHLPAAARIEINAHPQQRRFLLFKGEKLVRSPALAAHLDLDFGAARRIPGVLWEADTLDSKLSRVSICCDN